MEFPAALFASSLILSWILNAHAQNDTIFIAGVIPQSDPELGGAFRAAVELSCNVSRNRSEFQELFRNYEIRFKWKHTNVSSKI